MPTRQRGGPAGVGDADLTPDVDHHAVDSLVTQHGESHVRRVSLGDRPQVDPHSGPFQLHGRSFGSTTRCETRDFEASRSLRVGRLCWRRARQSLVSGPTVTSKAPSGPATQVLCGGQNPAQVVAYRDGAAVGAWRQSRINSLSAS